MNDKRITRIAMVAVAILALFASSLYAFHRNGVNVNVAVGNGAHSNFSGFHSFSYGHNFASHYAFDPYPVTAFSFTAPLALQSYAYFNAPTFVLQAQPPVFAVGQVVQQVVAPQPAAVQQTTTTTTTTTPAPAVLPGDPGVSYRTDPAPVYQTTAYDPGTIYPLVSGLFRVGALYGTDFRAIARVNYNPSVVDVNVLARARFRDRVNVAVANGGFGNQQINVNVHERPRLLGRRGDNVHVAVANQNGQVTRVDVARGRPGLHHR